MDGDKGMRQLTILERVWMALRGLFTGGPVSRSGLVVLVLALLVIGVACWLVFAGAEDKT